VNSELAHLNLMEVNELLTRAEPGGVVDRRGGELLFAGAHPFPLMNGAMRAGGGPADAFVERACDFFAERERGWIALVHPDDAEFERAVADAGLHRLMEYPEMVCAERSPEPAIDDVELRQVAGEADARTYWSVCELAYRSLGFPAGVFDSFTPTLLLLDQVGAWIADAGGVPAATAMIAISGRVGMVCWVATLDDHRGRGLAGLCTARATNAAFDRGCELASLQASPMGESLYRTLGYTEAYRYQLFIHGRFA
jgi:GNAT superfamily N-acetyltransferase